MPLIRWMNRHGWIFSLIGLLCTAGGIVSRCAAAAEVGKQRIVFPVAAGSLFRHRHHTGALLCAFTGIQDPAAVLHSCGG